jgi:hypothetical protein
MKDKIIDAFWKATSFGLSLAIQAPTEFIKYTKKGVPTVNGRERPDLPNWPGLGIHPAIKTQKGVHVQYGQDSVRRMIVFK